MQKGDEVDVVVVVEIKLVLAEQFQAPFPGADASEEIESSASQGTWGEFTVILGFGRGNIEGKSGERLGYRVHRSTLAARQPPSSLHTKDDLSEPCPRYPLVDIEQ